EPPCLTVGEVAGRLALAAGVADVAAAGVVVAGARVGAAVGVAAAASAVGVAFAAGRAVPLAAAESVARMPPPPCVAKATGVVCEMTELATAVRAGVAVAEPLPLLCVKRKIPPT